MELAKCRSCAASIMWVKTPKGKSMPVDAAEVEYGGNIVIRDGVAIILKMGEPSEAGEKRYKSHFATCVNAAAHRGR